MAAKKKSAAKAKPAPAPEAAAEWCDPASLVPWARNPRHNDASVPAVMESIQRFGFGAPIVARLDTREIIAGHTRWKAAKALDMHRVPVRFLDITEADAHLLAVADNKLGEIAEWNEAEVARILSDYSLADAEIAGFDRDALDKLAGAFDDQAEDETEKDRAGDPCPTCGKPR